MTHIMCDTIKKVQFSDIVTIFVVPRHDECRFGKWIDYCPKLKKCKSADVYISKRYKQRVSCCSLCGHVRNILNK
jgi:hypothetical protein